MKIIVGLGNPGKKYEETRHNAGFLILDELKSQIQNPKSKILNAGFTEHPRQSRDKSKCSKFKLQKRFNAEICKLNWQNKRILLVKPQTFMNESGKAVKKIVKPALPAGRLLNCSMAKLSESLWIIHDDLDLALGKLKISQGRGPAGHKGVESIIKELGTKDFVRFRVGIGKIENCKLPALGSASARPGKIENCDNYVLGEFEGEERKLFEKMIKRCSQAVLFALEKGLEKAMNRYN